MPLLIVDIRSNVWITRQALERLQEHYPAIGVPGAHRLLDASQHIAQGEASGFLCRPMEACQDEYFIAPGRAGIFVMACGRNRLPTDRPWSLVTYLRLAPSQVAQAVALWGP